MKHLHFISFLFVIRFMAEAAVLKQGKRAPISINQIFTTFGQWYMRNNFFKLIYPGTKWCGDGDIANNYDDLGFFKETDMCCRDHDNCDDILFSGENKENLINANKFTRLHCKCDMKFHSCLSNVNSDRISARLIGLTYFNILIPKCYYFIHPAVCAKFETTVTLNKRCTLYQYNNSMPKIWQWFDVPQW